jgi:hypothetical protein
MVKDFPGKGPDGEPLTVGKPAAWVATNPTEVTKGSIVEFVAASGLGPGDQLIEDPFSRLWELSLDASDVKFGQKGMKVDFQGLKAPTKALMHKYRYMAPDICFTAHQKMVYKANQPTDEVAPSGESSTATDILFEFRMEESGSRMVVSKEKGRIFKLGESFDNPVLREIFTARGLYDFVSGLKEVGTPVEMNDDMADRLLAPQPVAGTLAEGFMWDMRVARDRGLLAEFRADPDNRKRAALLSPAELAEVRKLAESLA